MRGEQEQPACGGLVMDLHNGVPGQVPPNHARLHVEVVEPDVAFIVGDNDVLANRVPRQAVEDDIALVALLEDDLLTKTVERLKLLVVGEREKEGLHRDAHDPGDAQLMNFHLTHEQKELVGVAAAIRLHIVGPVNVHVALRIACKDRRGLALANGDGEEPSLLGSTRGALLDSSRLWADLLPDAQSRKPQKLSRALVPPHAHEAVGG
mmetsp:Transcript_104214/g.222748  ORF Transcript_104214/g.222748 Transcript_104214/m.222748 type:complete len:208 (+) Transcript_104214:1228-1851(+)